RGDRHQRDKDEQEPRERRDCSALEPGRWDAASWKALPSRARGREGSSSQPEPGAPTCAARGRRESRNVLIMYEEHASLSSGQHSHPPSECAVMPVGIAYTQNQLAPKGDKSVLDTAMCATHDAPEEHTRATCTRPEEPPRELGAAILALPKLHR